MKLEVGKSYKNRGGYIRRIASYSSVTQQYKDFYGTIYNNEGKFIFDRGTMLDLIEEYIESSKEITTEDINNAAMEWYTNNFKHSNVIPSIKSSWNAAIEWYKSQLNQE